MHQHGVSRVDGILYDLGVSSPQLDEAERGFSYHQDAPLDMRMDQTATLTAYEVVNQFDYHQLVKIFFRYGEEKFSKQIAREIERVRQDHPIETTGELVDIIKTAIPAPARSNVNTEMITKAAISFSRVEMLFNRRAGDAGTRMTSGRWGSVGSFSVPSHSHCSQ